MGVNLRDLLIFVTLSDDLTTRYVDLLTRFTYHVDLQHFYKQNQVKIGKKASKC